MYVSSFFGGLFVVLNFNKRKKEKKCTCAFRQNLFCWSQSWCIGYKVYIIISFRKRIQRNVYIYRPIKLVHWMTVWSDVTLIKKYVQEKHTNLITCQVKRTIFDFHYFCIINKLRYTPIRYSISKDFRNKHTMDKFKQSIHWTCYH